MRQKTPKIKNFKFLSHTADVKFQAFGKSLEEAFDNSTLALTNIICDDQIKGLKRIDIKVNGNDLESLLYNFLEEVIYVLETKGFLLDKVKKIKINKEKFRLEAELAGDKVKNYELSGHFKAITYNDMFVKHDKKKKQWICQVVVDV